MDVSQCIMSQLVGVKKLSNVLYLFTNVIKKCILMSDI